MAVEREIRGLNREDEERVPKDVHSKDFLCLFNASAIIKKILGIYFDIGTG